MKNNSPQLDSRKNPADASAIVFVLLGFLATYLLFFVCPVFLNSASYMQVYPVVPRETPIGLDLKQASYHFEEVFVTKTSPYTGSSLYPPLFYILFGPFIAVDLHTGYIILTIINISCFICMTLVFPYLANNRRHFSPLLILIFVTGLFSYGYQFEVERGQFNIITMFFVVAAVLVYHNYYRFRYLAYLLFSLAVQSKIYPAIFIFMLVRDWKDWKSNIKRFAGLGAFNFALLFILGPRVFLDFVGRVTSHMKEPFIWLGNHSIRSFVEVAAVKFGWLAKEDTSKVQFLLFAIVAVCMFLVLVQAYRQNHKGINPNLFIACTCVALLIPSESHDYVLSILVAPVALAFHNDYFANIANYRPRREAALLMFVFSFAYSSMLYTYHLRYLMLPLMCSNLPALMVMLFITAVFLFIHKPENQTIS